jgi:hypothetical protein
VCRAQQHTKGAHTERKRHGIGTIRPRGRGMGRHGQIRADVVKGLTSSSGDAFSRITWRYSWYLRTKGRYKSSLLLSRMSTFSERLVLLVLEPICKRHNPEVMKVMAAAVVVVVVVVVILPYLPSVPHLPLYSPGPAS